MSPSGPALLAVFLASLPLTPPCAATDRPIAFPLRVATLDGREAALAPDTGLLHVVFFATWCPACVEELRPLSDLAARYPAREYRLVLVAVPTRQTPERLTSFVRSANPPGEIFFDTDGSASEACGARHLPLHLLFDAKGQTILRSESLVPSVGATVERILGKGRGGGRSR